MQPFAGAIVPFDFHTQKRGEFQVAVGKGAQRH